MATESFFSNASLAYLASAGAGKDGKTYSIKPTDGSGDFTFSRGSNLAATRVGADGLIEKGRENLLLQSNQFDTSPWIQSLGASGGVISGQIGYDGTNDAWKINSKGALYPYVHQSVSQSGVHTFSVYAKRGDVDFIRLLVIGGSNPDARFDLFNGTAPFVSGGALYANIEPVGTGGWYRCSLAVNIVGSSYRIYPMVDTGTFAPIDEGIYVQNAQLEIGLAATDVISTGATTGKAGLLEDEPRFDYSGGATCPSLLLEPSRTNLFLISEPASADGTSPSSPSSYLGSLDWGIGNVYGGVQLDGGATTYHYGATVAVSTTYAISFFIRRTDSGVPIWATSSTSAAGDFMMYIGGAGVGIGDLDATPSITLFKNDVYKVEAIYTTPASVSSPVNTGILKTSANSANSVQATGFQFEVGTYPTSYIPNHSGTGSVTRGDDRPYLTLDLSSIAPKSAGTMYLEYDADVVDNGAYWVGLSTSSSSLTDWVFIGRDGASNRLYIRANGSAIDSTSIAHSTSGTQKLAIVWNESTGTAAFINGTKVDSTTGSFSFAGNFGHLNLGGSTASNPVSVVAPTKQLLIFPEALSDADCINITSL
jgi:hypothetical protein